MSPSPPLRIGTRKSLLARTQTGHVQAEIARRLGMADTPDQAAPLTFIVTTGDRIQDRPLMDLGGKSLFTKEIERALLDGEIDLAVHSLKDVPAEPPEGLVIAALPPREDARDAFLSERYDSLQALPEGARLGTASLRRQAQALAVRPDLTIESLRGNVDTRLRRLADGDFDAILLAAAGLNRLGLGDRIRNFLDPWAAPTAPGQGALALQCRADGPWTDWIARLNDPITDACVAAERGALMALEANCRTAMGAYARPVGDQIELAVEALTPDGTTRWRREGRCPAHPTAARCLGFDLGISIRDEAGDRLTT
ncbi:MAG: hydroxymethylbilane synthase [Caulobacterales bacterium]|nr:hydroxymethylbilane synthase [Caulobacterales bacterium]